MATVTLLHAEFALAPDGWTQQGSGWKIGSRRYRVRLRDGEGTLVKSALWKRTARDGCPALLGAYRALCLWFADNPGYDLDVHSLAPWGTDLRGAMERFTEEHAMPAPRRPRPRQP